MFQQYEPNVFGISSQDCAPIHIPITLIAPFMLCGLDDLTCEFP